MSVVVVMPVGPGEFDLQRAGRVARSLVRWETDIAGLVLATDGVTEAAIRQALGPLPFDVRVVANPRNGQGDGGYDGLAVGLTAAYAVVARDFAGAHVLKIDTDALVVGPFAQRLDDYFAAHPAVGMAGTYERNPDGTSRDPEFYFGDQVARKFLRPLWYWHSKRWLSSPYFGRYRRFARWMRRAHALGLPLGRHVQGGSYALAGATLAAWRRDGLLDDPLTWLHVPSGEDGAFSIWTVLAGFELANFNGPSDVFAVRAKGMPLSPEAVVARGYAVVHCLKTGDWRTEIALAQRLDELAVAKATGGPIMEPAQPAAIAVVVSDTTADSRYSDSPLAWGGFSHIVIVRSTTSPAGPDRPGVTQLVAPTTVTSPDGRAAALATAFGHVARRYPMTDVVVLPSVNPASAADADLKVDGKLDAEIVAAAFAGHPEVGVAGKVDAVLRVQIGGSRLARWNREVARSGAPRGSVSGDSFAVSGLALRAWLERGWLERPAEWIGLPTDPAAGFSLWATRCGMHIGSWR